MERGGAPYDLANAKCDPELKEHLFLYIQVVKGEKKMKFSSEEKNVTLFCYTPRLGGSRAVGPKMERSVPKNM